MKFIRYYHISGFQKSVKVFNSNKLLNSLGRTVKYNHSTHTDWKMLQRVLLLHLGGKLVSHTVPPQQCFRLMSEDMLALIWSASKTLDWKVIHCFVPVLEKKPHSCTFTSMNWYGYCETAQKICSPPPRKIIFTPKSQVYLFSALPTIHFLRF